jgi:hypothetical protein
MTEERARIAWDTNKDYYNQFDCIITSDTALLSRIFLQGGYKGKLCIWICNRFDYWDTSDGTKVDEKYYELFRGNKPNVRIIANNVFEAFYARFVGKVPFHEIINPASKPYHLTYFNKQGYYVPTYSNDTLLKLYIKCLIRGIEVTTGRYQDWNDLARFKAVIHLPYTWNSIALWDALACGVAYYVPSQEFLLKLLETTPGYWFQNANYCKEHLNLCEFYREKNNKFIKYFSSFDELYDIEINSEEVYAEAEQRFKLNQDKWKDILWS